MVILMAMSLALADPLTPATTGQLQCYAPDVARKTCQSLAAYAPLGDGTIINTATVLITPTPVLTMETAAPVTIEGGAVCGAIRRRDLDQARFAVGGQPLDPAKVEPLRQQIASAFAPILDRHVCTTHVPDGAAWVANVTIDGVAQPALSQKVIWVSPGDGYSVAP